MGCVESNVPGSSISVEEVASPSRGAPAAVQRQPTPTAGNFHEKYDLGEKIGEGTFGEVRVAKHRSSNTQVAVKVLEAGRGSNQGNNQNNLLSPRGTTPATPRGTTPTPPGDGNSRPPSPRGAQLTPRGQARDPLAKFQKAVQNEVSMLLAVSQHRQCIQLHEYFNDLHTCFLVFELCTQGTVLRYLDARPLATVPEQQRLLKEMALGVAHVHEVGIVHRDVKPDNFLVGGDDGKTIKLSDFGTATRMPKDRSLLRAVSGTAPYMSPEMLNDDGYDQMTDVWSFGASCYMILYGDIPYGPKDKPLTSAKIKAAIIFGDQVPAFQQAQGCGLLAVPKGAEDLVSGCLQRDFRHRLSSSKVLRHAFLRDVKVPEGHILPGQGKSKSDATEASWPGSEASTQVPAAQAKSAGSWEGSSRQNSKNRQPS